jgi:hypothetical protein
MPKRDPARRGRIVDVLSTLQRGPARRRRCGYQAVTMRFSPAIPISLFVALAASIPIGMNADVPASSESPIGVSATAGLAAIRAVGTVAGPAPFRAIVYAAFAPEIPTVLLGRRVLTTDAGGHFNTTFPIAPAYFRGAIITVIVQTATGVVAGRGTTTIDDPTLAAPVRDEPPSSRAH